MPIIKDKYSAKGDNPRSRYEKFIPNIPVDTNKLNTEQKQVIATNAARIESGTNLAHISTIISPTTSTIDTTKPKKIEGFTFNTASIVESAFTLEANQSIEDILVSHHHVSGTRSVVGLYWSTSPKADLSFTISGNGVTATPKQSLFRIFTETFPSGSSISLRGYGAESFSNFNKIIYFYAVCSVVGPTITVVKS